MKVSPSTRVWTRIGTVAAVCVTLSSAAAYGQSPQMLARARDACNAVAAREGYRITRRDHENMSGNTYMLPFHVQHGTTEADVTCSYDSRAGVATLPVFREAPRPETPHGSRAQEQAQQFCESFVNARKGYQVQSVGNATKRGANWDIPLRVRQNGRSNVAVTCRYNTVTNKALLR